MAAEMVRVDIVSDVVCPWCIVGYQQLAQAAKDTGIAVDVHWHPFELNPQMPAEGQNLTEHIMEKYGSTREQSAANRDRLMAIGAELDFTFAFDDETRMHNTFNTHQLIHWATTQGRGDEMKQAFFGAHFTKGRDLSDVAELAAIAAEAGFDADEAAAVLADQRYAQAVRQEQNFWIQQGISGVPAMVFNQKHLVTGAQGVANYTNILKHLTGSTQTAAE